MAGRVKRFDCGHSGKGQWCHRCAEVQRGIDAEARAAAERAAAIVRRHLDFARLFPNQARDRDHFPPQVIERAVELGLALECGEAASTMRGHRMPYDRTVFRFNLPGHHRLVVEGDGRGPMSVMTHEQYNHLFAGGAR